MSQEWLHSALKKKWRIYPQKLTDLTIYVKKKDGDDRTFGQRNHAKYFTLSALDVYKYIYAKEALQNRNFAWNFTVAGSKGWSR